MFIPLLSVFVCRVCFVCEDPATLAAAQVLMSAIAAPLPTRPVRPDILELSDLPDHIGDEDTYHAYCVSPLLWCGTRAVHVRCARACACKLVL